MLNKFLTFGLLAATVFVTGCQQESATTTENNASPAIPLESNIDQISYLLGYNSTAQFVENGIEVNEAAFQLGASDGLISAESRLSDEQAEAAFTLLQADMAEKAETQYQEILQQNSERSAAFLAENAMAEGVVTTESGLQYKILEAGEGPMPNAESVVQVHYEGSTIDGTVFDSSYSRGEPVEFALNQVISGWTEGLQLMPEGSIWELYLPPALGYGEAGAPGAIGPNEALIFKVELLQANYEVSAE